MRKALTRQKVGVQVLTASHAYSRSLTDIHVSFGASEGHHCRTSATE